jgi:chromatin remodeling complex protein RSC6
MTEVTEIEDEMMKEFNEICEDANSIKNALNDLMAKLKSYKKKIEKLNKESKPKTTKSKKTKDEGDNVPEDEEKEEKEEKVKKTRKTKKVKEEEPPSGITKPCRISDELANFLDKPIGTEMTRADVTKELYNYINTNGLQNKSEKVKINLNQPLADLLGIESSQEVTYFNIQSLMNKHYIH